MEDGDFWTDTLGGRTMIETSVVLAPAGDVSRVAHACPDGEDVPDKKVADIADRLGMPIGDVSRALATLALTATARLVS